ncbi:hypothetical protein Acr_20g0006950 [Actinidia rufa]|uniref:DUF659 domain-containing protein n=1 Tax=Actinidia rufa TaxID=165716 RepID=A0A7J0GDJ8_9ERIC|nr:hypothetical protein Acr_20g0006950 [Actinidia rufa]
MDLTQNIYYEDEDQDEHENEGPSATPLWRYVTKVTGEKKAGGGSAKHKTRRKETRHRFMLEAEQRNEGFAEQEEEDAQILFVGNAKAKKTSKGKADASSPSMKRTIADIFKTSDREDVDQTVARGYKAPNYEKIRTSLLDKEQSKVQRALNPFMQDWSTHGLSIASDGRAVFVNGHDVSGMEKNGLNIAEFIFKAIDFVGPSNMVQVVTDIASHCKAAGAIIQEKHPRIFWSGCLAHALNLLMKDIGKSSKSDPSLSFFNESYGKGKAMVKEPLPTTVEERDNAVLYESEDDDTPATIVVGTGSSSSVTGTLSTPSPLVQQKTQ